VRAVWVDADAQVRGRLDDGSRWSVAALERFLVLGQPDVGRVTLAHLPQGEERLSELVEDQWDVAEMEFGAALAAGPPAVGEPWDLWVGAPGAHADTGALALFRGAATAGPDPDLLLRADAPGNRLGTAIARCADLTGDGRVEWLAAAPRYSPPLDEEHPAESSELAGAVFLLESELFEALDGKHDVREAGRAWWGNTVGQGLGTSLECAHDVTGDGVADVVVGAPRYGSDRAGRVLVLSGANLPSAGPIGAVATREISGIEAEGWFGVSLTVADFDVDGQADLAVGSPGARGGTGSVLLYSGDDLASETRQIAPRTTFDLRDREPGRHLGRFVTTGDIDGNRVPDLLVGAPDWALPNAHDAGRLFIWHGGPAWAGTEIAGEDNNRAVEGGRPYQRVGRTAFFVDLDDDGDDDLLIPTRDSSTTR
jgi:hypothetical protein